MRLTFANARLVDFQTDLPSAAITLDNHTIAAIGDAATGPGIIIDAHDMTIVPGFIDIHVHGGGGFNLHTTDPAEIDHYSRWVAKTGVTSFLIAVVGVSDTIPEKQLCTAVTAIKQGTTGATPLGIHLEGPYINPKRRGAHPISWLRQPNQSETDHLIEITDGYLRIVTLAPELPDGNEMIHQLSNAGVTVSLGHSDANYIQALDAISHGVTHMTHCYNAMRPLLHRDPGPLAALVQSPQVFGELIVDGHHVHPAMLDVMVRLLTPQRTIVITDAQAAAGMGNIEFEFAGQPATIVDGVALLSDGTIAGSVLTMDRALRNVLAMTHVTLSEAVGMQTWNPAQATGVADRKGLLQVGYDADLTILDSSLAVLATIRRGQVIYINPDSQLAHILSPANASTKQVFAE
jgi:N-acetylglucosamine-6-phosphate deacetylase